MWVFLPFAWRRHFLSSFRGLAIAMNADTRRECATHIRFRENTRKTPETAELIPTNQTDTSRPELPSTQRGLDPSGRRRVSPAQADFDGIDLLDENLEALPVGRLN